MRGVSSARRAQTSSSRACAHVGKGGEQGVGSSRNETTHFELPQAALEPQGCRPQPMRIAASGQEWEHVPQLCHGGVLPAPPTAKR